MTKQMTVSHEALFAQIAQNIKAHKRQILWVGKTSKSPSFAYTIGNQEKQLPELLLIANIPGEMFHLVLDSVSEFMVQNKRRFTDGERHTLGTGHPMMVIDAKDPKIKLEYTVQAGQFYDNEDYEVQQVLIPDIMGILPDDERCAKPFKVPVFKSALILPGDFKRRKK
jgi:hypothetical protein